MIQAGLRLIDFSQKMTMVAVQIITILDRPALDAPSTSGVSMAMRPQRTI